MNDGDVQKLKGIIKEEVSIIVKEEVIASEQRLRSGLREEITQVIKEEVSASEHRLETKIKQLGDDIGDLISNQVLPQIGEKADKTDIERLERKIDRTINKDIEQDRRFDRIESIPVIALDLKKSKRH